MVQNAINVARMYLGKAATFYEGAQMIIQSPAYDWERHDAVVLNNLLLSIEMSLKACLYTLDDGEIVGHEIDSLLCRSIKAGLLVDAEDARHVFLIARPYIVHAPRYAPFHDKNAGMAPASVMAPVSLRILERANAFVSSDMSPYDGISHEDAQEIRAEATKLYQQTIEVFDPTRIYEPKDAPNIPLGTRVATSRPEISKKADR